MRIKNSIKTVTVFPIMIVIFLSAYIVVAEYLSFKTIENTTKNISEVENLKNLLIESLTEREIAIQTILSNSNEKNYDYNQQIKKTNSIVNSIVNIYNQNKDDKLIYKIIEDIKQIVNIRNDVKNRKISYERLYSIYNNLPSDILLKTMSIQGVNCKKINLTLNSYKTSLKLYKDVSDERDFIAKIFTKNADIDNLYMVKVLKNSNIYQSYLQLDDYIKTFFSNHLSNNNFLITLQESNNIKKELLINGYTDKYNLNKWYILEDKKLNYLSIIDNELNTKLKKDLSFEGELTLAKIFASFILFLLSTYMLYKYFKLKRFFYDRRYLKLLLQKAINRKKVDKKVNLDTTEGIEKAYKLIDITLDKIEIERQKAQRENASKTIFLANMSHEIRTPINGIIGFTDLLKKSNLDKEQREYIDIISKSTDNLLEIINNILDLSKIESKKIEIDSIIFSPIEEFENAVELFIAKAAKKDITLSLFLDPTFENYLVGDALKVKEVLLNLISNSIKFTPNGGEINVRIKKLEEENYGKEKIYFEITDNGIGMSEDELSEVFEAFSQADSTITRRYGGTGLGLTISSNYVSLLGGELEVYSKKDEGTSFFFTLEFKKSQPLKIVDYKNSFKHINPLIITDKNGIKLAKFLQDYLAFFTSEAKYIDVDSVKNNISLFDRANLIVITKKIYEKYDFSYIKDTNKKLLILEPTKEYINNSDSYGKNIYKSIEPIGFFKTVKILTDIYPPKVSMLGYKDKKEKESKKSYKALVAEDNDINMQLIENILKQYSNITIQKAINGQIALDKFMNEKFDFILMDIAMPTLDGISATKKIIEYEEINFLSHTPIIALTANALKGDKEKFLSAGMDEYITKPIKEELLLDKLNKFGIVLNKKTDTSTTTFLLEDTHFENAKETLTNLEQKDILIYKKSEVETKIFEKVLSSIYKDIDIAKNTDEFLELIENNNYKAILLDKELQKLDIEKLTELKKRYRNSAFILFRNFETKISNRLRAIFDETIINSADKGYLKTVLDNYIK